MSLVTEALRKARQEAAAKEAARRGKPVSFRAARPPRGPFDARKVLAVAALVLGAALAGAGLVWWMLDREAPAAGPVAGAPGPPGPASVSTTASPTASMGVLTPGPGTRIEPAAPPPGITAGGGGPTRTLLAQETPTASPVAQGSTAPVAATPRPEPAPAPSGANARERVFVLDADLGRVKLHLDFVVFKPSAPFARINGQQVVPGSIVEGWLVEEIGRDFVRLSDGHGTVVLRVR